jgi:segregation and condensation protein B
MATKPEHHDVVRAFARSLKPPIRLSIAALETLAVIAYKQPVTAPEISEIRGVEAAGVLGTLLDRKLITTAGRKQVIGRPILYKTSKQFLLRFGLNELSELPSMEEFEKLALDGQEELFTASPQTAASEEPEAPAPEETVPEAASAEPAASSSPFESETPAQPQTPDKSEPDAAPANSAEDNT